MASQTLCYTTQLPDDVIDIIDRDLSKKHDESLIPSKIAQGNLDLGIRHSQNAWVPKDHWVSGFIMHYVHSANRTNFLYDLDTVDGGTLQYTVYNTGCFYGWHTDQDIDTFYKPVSRKDGTDEPENVIHDIMNENTELVRKLSFSLQLSDYDEYEGGNLQLMNGLKKSYFVPRHKGTLVVFDSRTQHRVQKVKKGIRKSIVGWCVGPRWR